jgi:restriction system protein
VARLRAIRAIGDSSSIEEIVEKVVELEDLPEDQPSMPPGNGPGNDIQYRRAWSRTYLRGTGRSPTRLRVMTTPDPTHAGARGLEAMQAIQDKARS